MSSRQVLVENQIEDEADYGNEGQHHDPCQSGCSGLSFQKQNRKDKDKVYGVYYHGQGYFAQNICYALHFLYQFSFQTESIG
jgi:hypothetical protein